MMISNQGLIIWKWDWAESKADSARDVELSSNVRLANSKARMKPTAPLSAFDKKNSIEFPLDSVHYLYKQSNPNPVLLSCASLWVNLLSRVCWYYKLKEKKKKRNNDLANLPSHDSTGEMIKYKKGA